MALEFLEEREAVGYNEHVFFSLSVKDSIGGVEGGLFLSALGIPKLVHPHTIPPLLAILERVLRRGGHVADDGRVV